MSADDGRDILKLAATFPPATEEDWRAQVEKVLKGASFERLISTTHDGLRIQPLYHRVADAAPVVGRAPGKPWTILQRVDHPDPAQANAQALDDLENGATGLALVFTGAIGAYGYGLDGSEAALERALEGVHLDAGVTIDCDLSTAHRDVPARLAALVRRRGANPADVDLRAGYDPLRTLAFDGRMPRPWPELATLLADLVRDLKAQGFAGPHVVADGRIIHAAGGSEAQELAYVLAGAVAYLRALEGGGLTLDDARAAIAFRLAADADQFLTMAKFRAVRRLWARVQAACGLAPRPAFVAAETAWRMLTRRDPWVNMLRATTATFAAGLGGADAVTVLPLTQAIGLPDEFARRMARNTQLILLEESNLFRVADPAAGAGGIEDLTDQLCHAAWALFQEIEAAGGAAAALAHGLLQRKVAAVRAAREAAVARRQEALTGTSEFPDIREAAVAVLSVPPCAPLPPPPGDAVEPLRPIRLAAPFEALRDASDRMLEATGTRPKIFLANLGPVAAFTARAMFAKNLFEAGGIEAVTNDGFASHDDMAAAYKTSGALLACLCSSDAIYESEAVPAAEALASAGARAIYLAGRPENAEALRAAGVTGFVHAGCDALATLQAAHATIAGTMEREV